MVESTQGDAFVVHVLDEAIAVQRGIIEVEDALAEHHPLEAVRRELRGGLVDDRRALHELEELGGSLGATGRLEEVARGLIELVRATVRSLGQSESGAYGAHAMLLTLKRRQQDMARALIASARAIDDVVMGDMLSGFEREQRQRVTELCDHLAELAARIAGADRMVVADVER